VCEAVKGVELSGPASSSLLDSLAKKVTIQLKVIFNESFFINFFLFHIFFLLQCQEGLADTGGNVGSMEFVSTDILLIVAIYSF